MPNHVYNEIVLPTEKLSKVQAAFLRQLKRNLNDKECNAPLIDLLVPFPDELKNTTSPVPKKRDDVTDKSLIEILETLPKKYGSFGEVKYDGNIYQKPKDRGWIIERWPTQEEVDADKEKENPRGYITEEYHKYLIEKYGSSNWYDWRVENQGSKWGDYETTVTATSDNTIIEFTTAWSPPSDNVFLALSKIFPTFAFSYEEEQGWGGILSVRNGEVESTETWEEPIISYINEDDYEGWDDLSDTQKSIINDSGMDVYYSDEVQGHPDRPIQKGFFINWPSHDETVYDSIDEVCIELIDIANHRREIDKVARANDELVEFLDNITPGNYETYWQIMKDICDRFGDDIGSSIFVSERVYSIDRSEFKDNGLPF